MKKHRFRLLIACMISVMFVLSGCSSDGVVAALEDAQANLQVGEGDGTTTGELNEDGIDTGIAATATTVAGKVTLSSVISGKALQKAAISSALKRGKPGSPAYNKALASMKAVQDRALPSRASGAEFSNGIVELYNASRPDWVYPIATTTTDAEGIYTLSTLINSARNGNEYEDGGLIPGGNYTILAYTIHPKTKRPYLVALQSVVSQFAGTISGIDLVAQTSTAEPAITTMLGVAKNGDGTQTWGDNELILAPNAAIQIAFSMAMNRAALTDLELDFAAEGDSTIPMGVWTLSADWLTATYYLNEGESWITGETYTITVHGADTTVEKTVDGFPFTGEDLATFNIFGKSLKLTGVGTFMVPEGAVVDTQSPTAQLSSPTLAQTANPIEITTPIRVASNERMDVNGLRLNAEPSLGAQPGVLFVGKNADELFEYEFTLGEPLKLDTTYDITVSGGKDLAGNEMNPLPVSFTTVATTAGVMEITDSSTPEEIATANAQADVKDVFGKWVRAFDDRNMPQLQGLMTGDFFLEYASTGGFEEDDINRDSMYDLQEFSALYSKAFIFWDFCGVEISGSVVDTINIVGSEADFEFTLTSTTTNNSQECKESAADKSLFATLEKINGAWYIKRASIGVDTRGQEIVQADLLTLISPENGGTPLVIDDENAVKFEWAAIDAAVSYAWIIVDSRNPQLGMALILPSTMTSMDIPGEIDTLLDAKTIAGVSEDFGFTDEFSPRDGSEIYWQVAALGGNTVRDVLDGRQTDLPKDVIAISELYRFTIEGEYIELDFAVEADGTSATYSELIRGFDVGTASTATVTITTPRVGASNGFLIVEGNTRKEYEFMFSAGVGTVTVDLNQGQNQIEVMDGVPCWAVRDANGNDGCDEDSRDDFVEERFKIITAGGIAPVISFDSVSGIDENSVETVLVNDGWNFYQSSDATMLKITGSVDCTIADCTKLRDLRYNVWNDQQFANASGSIMIDQTSGDFMAEFEIYQGENWINFHGNICDDTGSAADPGGCQNFNVNLGVKTSAGSVYVAPFQMIVVTEDVTVLAQKENWGNGGNWTAMGDQVVITGTMEYGIDVTGVNNPSYDIGSDGGWQSDRLLVDPVDGSFEIIVDLYDGFNYINLRDAKDNWFNLSVYTEGGKAVIRPEIVTVDGVAYAGGDVSSTQCNVNVEGTAMEGKMMVYWNANAELKTANANGETFVNFRMEQELNIGVDGAFDVTMPLVGGEKYNFSDNFIEIFDNNWNWMGTRVVTTGDCEFIPPQISVLTAKTSPGDMLIAEDSRNDYGEGGNVNFRNSDWSPIVTDKVMLEGTFSGNVSTIKVEPQCGSSIPATLTEAGTWSVLVDVYDGFNGFNITDGRNQWWVNVDNVDSSIEPTPPIDNIMVASGSTDLMNWYNGCNNSDWGSDSGSVGTLISEVTITGVALASASKKGEYNIGGVNSDFDFDATGAFSITIPVFQGFNNIGINDADWNFMSVNVEIMNGPERPSYITIDPVNVTADSTTPTVISGVVLKQPIVGVASFIPDRISIQVNEKLCEQAATGNFEVCDWPRQEYTTDPNGFDWGALPMTLDGPDGDGNYTFSIEHMFTGEPDRLNVWVDGKTDSGDWANHGIDMSLLEADPNCPDCNNTWVWKPGAKAKQDNNPGKVNRLKALNRRGK